MSWLMPKRGQFLARAHANPLNITHFPYPSHHSYVDWQQHYPALLGGSNEQNTTAYCNTDQYPSSYKHQRNYSLGGRQVSILDIGCGYGGLLFALAPFFPDKLIFGLQIREKVTNYVAEKIRGHRILYPGQFDNISVVRTNTMRHLCQYFPKQSLQKIFICFPDPHFKIRLFKRRIISTGFLSEYAFLLKPQGKIYCITDVAQLHDWHMKHLRNHQMFEQVKGDSDPCLELMLNKTEEGAKVQRKGGAKYWGIFERRKFSRNINAE